MTKDFTRAITKMIVSACAPESAEKMVAKDVFIHHEAQGTFREIQVDFVPMKNPEVNP
ncbi:hypothetical protein [Paenibacillus sp. FSL H7-0331]|uniref:hypothetical protein n=1 Tax=Paenibacillus sp. FSL H7-0331 TaxID=1920421 RepID=UPI0015C31F43|nr:hypothetical protein [Paenibacillus sp. FSL H7-0331]